MFAGARCYYFEFWNRSATILRYKTGLYCSVRDWVQAIARTGRAPVDCVTLYAPQFIAIRDVILQYSLKRGEGVDGLKTDSLSR